MYTVSPSAAKPAAAQSTDDLLSESLARELTGLQYVADDLETDLRSGKAPAGDLVPALCEVHNMNRVLSLLMSHLFPSPDDD
jgi:hypothetical protein